MKVHPGMQGGMIYNVKNEATQWSCGPKLTNF